MPRPLTYRAPADPAGAFLPWLDELRNANGVYVIRRTDNKQALYVGESHTSRLAKTVKRHFYPWPDDPEREHHTYQKGRVEIAIRLTPPAAAPGAQSRLISRLDPRDNGNGWGEEPF